MKILLINPPLIFLKSVGMPTVFHPTGLAYVAASLEREHIVFVLDACAEGAKEGIKKFGGEYYLGMSFEEIACRVKEIKPDVVGISVVFSANEYSGLKTASVVKEVNQKIITILGGAHPSIRPIETLSDQNVDYVVINEGEQSSLELLRNIDDDKLDVLKAVNGIGFRENGVPFLTPQREFNEDLDSLPFPARHLLPMELYHESANIAIKARLIYSVDVAKKELDGSVRSASFITSRGCPYSCNFCSISLTMGRKFRKRSPENVIKELEELVYKYKITHVDFEDDNLTLDKERARRICDLIIEKSLGITWSTPNGIRADMIDEDLVIKMKESGCVRVFVAPESGVPEVAMEIINKKIDTEVFADAVRLFTKHRIIIDGSFVIGSVGKNGRIETKHEIWKTIQYAKTLRNLGMSIAGFNIAIPLYGTKLREYAEESNYLKNVSHASGQNHGNPIIETPEFSYDDLKIMVALANWVVNFSIKEKIVSLWRLTKRPWSYIKFFSSVLKKS